MPRTLDPMLAMALERANPNVCHFVEVNAPDVARVLRRAEDQFLAPLSQSPANSISADPAGTLTITSSATPLAAFTAPTVTSNMIPAASRLSQWLRGLAWQPDKAFGRAILRTFSARVQRLGTAVTDDLGLQIYQMAGHTVSGAPGQLANVVLTPTPLLAAPVPWRNTAANWNLSSTDTLATFDLSALHVEVGNLNVAAPSLELRGEESWYYFVIAPLSTTNEFTFTWSRDTTTAPLVAGVGLFADRSWIRQSPDDPFGWHLDTITPAVPSATITIESYLPSAQAIYALTMPAVPQAASVGRVVFERGVPTGADAVLELSTAGSGGPWTVVKHGDVVATHQATYHARVTLTSTANHRSAPRVAAIGIEFKTPVDVTAEAIVEPISQEIEVPFLKASIGEGSATVVRAGRRDYRDLASDLAALSPSSKLEVDVMLGSRHPLITRDKWLLVDRALVNNRDPSATSEKFGLLSYLKALKRKIPTRAESINLVRTVASASTTSVTVSEDMPLVDGDTYDDLGFYLRVRTSAQVGVASGYVKTIDASSGTPHRTLTFATPMTGTLIAGDVVEIHSAAFLQQGLTWIDADPADIWWEILTVHLLIATEKIGRGDLGRAGLSGLPPHVTDRESDPGVQEMLKVTFATKEAESADELIDQLSFLMGGATVDIGGQIVFRQIYPLRDANGQIVVPAEPIAATFDVRNTAGLSTPTGLEQRTAQLACDYGVNTTAVEKDTPPTQTTNFVDVDAIAWLDDQPFDALAAAAIPAPIARWCYNSADGGVYLASMLTQQVVRAASTGLRVWTWTATERQPHLVVGDRVAMITDRYTDYDPARKMPIRGWWAYTLAIVAVQGGGTRFRGFMLGLTDAVQIRGGAGTLAAAEDEGTDKTEILSVTFKDSADGTTRTYDVTCGTAVVTLHVHHRLWPIGTDGDPFDFGADEDIADGPQLIIVRPDPADGHFRFTIAHPSRLYQRFILLVPRQGMPALAVDGDVFKIILDPAPSGVFAKFKPTVHNDKADLSILLGAAVSDWPVTYDVVEGSPDNTPLMSITLSAPATIDRTTHAILGDRPLPLLSLLSWWVHYTNVAGEEDWLGPSSADRDPLANGVVTADTFRAASVFRMVFDLNTDSIRITLPDGRTKTWTRAQLDALGGPALYTTGDLLDDASTETALGVDENRTPYKVEYQGGGIWTTMFTGALHGVPSNPPTVRIRVVKNALGSTEDVFVVPSSPVAEKLRVYYRDGELATSPVYGLCVSAGDSTPLYVTSGTEVGPANFFMSIDGSGSPSAKLSGIALTSDQIKRVSVQVEGQLSLLRNSWTPVALSLLEKPFNQSLELVWDNALGKLRAIVVAGARCLFETIQFANNSAFTSPTSVTDVIAEGGTLIKELALSGAQRGVTWYCRAIPNSHTANDGLDGDPVTASVAVPALFTVTPSFAETVTQGTLTLVVADPGGVLDPNWTTGAILPPASTSAISFEVLRIGVRTIEAPTTKPVTVSTGTYTKTITLLDHPVQLQAFAHLLDGSTQALGAWTFDSNKISDAMTVSVAYVDNVATVTVRWDTDAKIGAATAHYSANGAAFVNTAVSAGLLSQFNVTLLSGSKQSVAIECQNVIDSAYGTRTTIELDAWWPDVGQGTVSIDANGVWSASADGSGNAASWKWSSSTSAYPVDSTVASSGTVASGRSFSVTSGGTLTFGQTVFITAVPFNAAGTQLSAIHLRGSYLTFSGSKTQTYSAALWEELISNNGIVWDGAHNATMPAILVSGYAMTLDLFSVVPNGVTITQVAINARWDTAGTPPTGFVLSFNRRTGNAVTSLGSVSPSHTGAWVIPVITLSETVSAGRSYVTFADWSAIGTGSSAGSAAVGDVSVTYTMPDPKQAL